MADIRSILPKSGYISKIDDNELACRSQRHDWPVIRANKPLPKGVNILRQHDGCFTITNTCKTCGTKRTKTTLPGGITNRNAMYTYEYPEHWTRIPRWANVSHMDLVVENDQRALGTTFAFMDEQASRESGASA